MTLRALLSVFATGMLLSACGGSDDQAGGTDSAGGAGGKAGGAGGASGTGGVSAAGGSSASSGAGGDRASAGSGGSAPGATAGGTSGGEAGGSTGATDDAGTADAPVVDAAAGGGEDGGAGPAGPFTVPPGMTKIFDGKTLTGWDGNPKIWSVDAAEMAIHGKTGGGGQLIKSKDSYDTFRLVLQEKYIATPNINHMGICFWGSPGGWGYGGCIDVIPPSGALWDYGPGGGQLPGGVGSANNGIKFMWHEVEILANATTGEILVAVNGKQTTDYKKAGRGKKGPIGLQSHAKANDQMYRDIWVDPAPKELKLLTVTP